MFNSIEEIFKAVDEGKKVKWHSDNYEVKVIFEERKKIGYVIDKLDHSHSISFYDGPGHLQVKLQDFYISEPVKKKEKKETKYANKGI